MSFKHSPQEKSDQYVFSFYNYLPRVLDTHLKRNLINFVVNIKTRQVDPVARDNINELVHGGVLPEQHLSVVDLVLGQDHTHLAIKKILFDFNQYSPSKIVGTYSHSL